MTQHKKWASASGMDTPRGIVTKLSNLTLRSLVAPLGLLFVGCSEPEVQESDKPSGDPYIGKWSGEWFDEDKDEATAVVRKDGDHYIAEVHDKDGLVTILKGKIEERGLEFLSSDDAPDRYLSLWHGLIEKGDDEFVATPHPVQGYQGFSMERVE